MKVLNRRSHQGSSLATQPSLMGLAKLCSASDAHEDTDYGWSRPSRTSAACTASILHVLETPLMSGDSTQQPDFRSIWCLQPHIPERFPPHGAGFRQEAGGAQGGQPQANW